MIRPNREGFSLLVGLPGLRLQLARQDSQFSDVAGQGKAPLAPGSFKHVVHAQLARSQHCVQARSSRRGCRKGKRAATARGTTRTKKHEVIYGFGFLLLLSSIDSR